MERLRSSWFALMGGVLLITLSVSVAFGAGPAATLDSPPGESIAEFVHGLIFSPDDPESEPEVTDPEDLGDPGEDEDGSHGECVSEVARSDAVGGPNDNHGGAVSEAANETCPDTDDEEPVVEEDPIEEEEPVVEENGDEDDSHGKCVSEIARSDEVGGPNDNHGGAVSEAARETCHDTDDEEPVVDEDPIEEEEPVVEENGDEDDSHGACVSAAAEDKEGSAESDDRNHGAWVSKHARFICRGLEPPDGEASADEDGDTAELTDKEERKAQQAAARAERKAERAAAKAAMPRGGHGRGGGRP